MTARTALAVALTAFLSPALAGDIRAIDGDSLALGAERIRVLGVDTPEIAGRCPAEIALARRARALTQALLDRGPVTIERAGRDRWGRTLARVWIDGRDLADLLIAAGLGRPYSGGRRQSWCRP
ncbi:MAG: hypothetical protein OHK0024_21080 [Thalassobaculales bacterium]